jgi:phenylacetate-CoA ligase
VRASLARRLAGTAYLGWQLRGQARYPFRSPAAIRRDQSRRIQATVAHAFRHVPYYRDVQRRLGLSPEEFRTAESLARLPVVERGDLRRDPERFVSDVARRPALLQLHSSGSTGMPVSVFYDAAALFQNAAHTERDRAARATVVGRRRGYRQTLIGPRGGVEASQRYLEARALLPSRLAIRSQMLSIHAPLEDTVSQLDRFRPDVIRTHGSYLALLFTWLSVRGVRCHRPAAAVFGGDGLPEAVRRLIEKDFGVAVFSAYQAIEALRIGFECESRAGFHLNVDLYPIRLVDPDGQPAPPGEPGEVLVSNLVSRGTMLLNYRLGDRAFMLEEPCPCGRTLPRLGGLLGRQDDFITLPSGRVLHPMTLGLPFPDYPDLWQYQIVQHDVAHLEVRIVGSPALDRQALRAHILRDWPRRLDAEAVSVDVRFVDRLETGSHGKVRRVITSVPPPA